ncbi:MAG: LysR family transcriptional regulator [Alcaligenaceae bacterium]|nr:LysR family transcriptional regulator [Alcaligenaceae bacterium]
MITRHLQDTALRYFHEVVRYGSISEAAQHLHVAPSAISRQIARLEQLLETTLFERHARGMVPTAEGEILADHARRMQLDAERALLDIMALRGLQAGRVRVAGSEAFVNEFLPPLIAAFQRTHQGIEFELNSAPPHAISDQVRSGDTDIGIKFSHTPDPDVHVELRQTAPVVVVMNPAHPLAHKSVLELVHLQDCTLALPSPESTLRQMLDIACSHQQLHLKPLFTSNNMMALHNFAAAGEGVTVSSYLSVRKQVQSGRLAAVPLRDPVLDQRSIEVQTLAGRTLPMAVNAFLDVLKTHLTR